MTAPDPETRSEHVYRLATVIVEGHGLACTTDAGVAVALCRAELERRQT